MYGTKPAAVLRQPSGLSFISVLLPIYPLLNQLTRAARYVASQEGTRLVCIPSHSRLGDPCVAIVRASYSPRKQKQSAAKINKGSRCGFLASDEPRPEYALEPNLCRYSPLPRLILALIRPYWTRRLLSLLP